MAVNTPNKELLEERTPLLSSAEYSALLRGVGVTGSVSNSVANLTPEQKTKLRIMTSSLLKLKEGKRPIRLAKGGYLFAPDELNDPRVKNRMKDNPEFSEFSVDQQDATANKMQQRFAQPEDRMNPTRGYAEGGATTGPPIMPPGFVAPAPDQGVTTALVDYYNPTTNQTYTAGTGGYTPGPGWIQGRPPTGANASPYAPPPAATPEVPLTPVQKLASDQATTMANVYSDPSKVVTPATVVSTPTSPDTTIAAGTGAVSGAAPSVAIPDPTIVTTATAPTTQTPQGVMTAAATAPAVTTATDAMTAASGTVGADSTVTAETDTTSAVSDLTTVQGAATLVTNPVQRKIEAGEIITGAANAATAATFTEQVQAATATPTAKATVKGQLDSLMDDFEGGATPAWAAGAMRAATAAMAARGLGASSMAGQAIIQATMESALPIAQADAQITAQFEAQNLSNRQQRAMLAAEQRATFMGMEFTQEFQARVQNSARIGDIANMNFTAEQQIALENGRAANTMNLANLSNTQALLLAEAAALSNLDMSNLNNRQQAAVQNAQNFMQMDMQNLSNAQQTSMFKQQSVIQSLFTDQAATNAASQFNATSENQTQQFFASLANQTQQFNATQTNAMSQFDAENVSTLKRFNSELDNQRDQFNAKNALVIAQANTQWRQNIATIDTAAQNQANMETAKLINGLTATSIDQIWQRERDLMSFAFTASESAADRAVQVAIQKLSGEQKAELQDNIGKGSLLGTLFTGIVNKYLPLPGSRSSSSTN